MSRTPNTHGGGARTNKNGLHFEQTTSLDNALCNAGYKVTNYEVYRGSQKIGMSVPQNKFDFCFTGIGKEGFCKGASVCRFNFW